MHIGDIVFVEGWNMVRAGVVEHALAIEGREHVTTSIASTTTEKEGNNEEVSGTAGAGLHRRCDSGHLPQGHTQHDLQPRKRGKDGCRKRGRRDQGAKK